jgi:hypothetical protein
MSGKSFYFHMKTSSFERMSDWKREIVTKGSLNNFLNGIEGFWYCTLNILLSAGMSHTAISERKMREIKYFCERIGSWKLKFEGESWGERKAVRTVWGKRR